MKKIIILSVLGLLITSLVFAQNFAGKKQVFTSTEPEKFLREGERLEYSVEWLGIPVGIIVLNLEGIKKIEGYDCYDISANAKANKFFSRICDIEYTVHTYVDKNNFYTRRFEKARRIKDKIMHTVINFDWEKYRADFKEEGDALGFEILLAGRKKVPFGTTTEILSGTQDLFSSLYYLRLFDLKENKTYALNIYYGKRNWPVTVKVSGPFPRELRKRGSFTVLKAEMYSGLNEFILGKNEIIVYFTADPRRIPIEFQFGTGIGSVRGKIKRITE